MKTSVNMIRNMGNFEIVQRTKDGMFNATELLKQWNKHSGQKKEIASFFKMNQTKEYIGAIKSDENLNMANSPYLKSRGRHHGGTWMHPYLFIDFAMWLNPKFKLQVIKFVYDQLIEFRHDAGDYYKLLHKSGARLPKYDYVKVAKALNHIVFGKHEPGILRQHATECQLKELTDIQKTISSLIDLGYITTFDGLMSALRKMWHKKYPKQLAIL